MSKTKSVAIVAILTVAGAIAAWSADAVGRQRAIDKRSSTMVVHVSKTGVFSALGHNHEVAAPIAGGSVDLTAHRVDLRVNAGALQVKDSSASDKDRAEIRKTMLGPEVLDSERYPEIVFQSTKVDAAGAGAWKVQGDLTLHGRTRPVTVDVKEQGGRYVGAALLKQTDFGITPVKVAGGAVKVKDELRIQFNIGLAGSEGGK